MDNNIFNSESDSVLMKLMHDKIKSHGFSNFNIVELPIYVNSPFVRINLDNDYCILTSKIIDITFTARLEIQSSDNLFVTSRKDFDNLVFSKHKIFSDYLEITLVNYGKSFIPYQLDFLKILPVITSENE